MNKCIIKISNSITINKNYEFVFTYFSNPENDKFWRSEINESNINKRLEKGSIVSEYSYLSKKAPNNLLELECIKYEENKLVIFETLEKSKFYEKSTREIEVINNTLTKIKYSLEFDINIVKYALGVSIPKFLVILKANHNLKKYLKKLKKNIENNNFRR